MSAPDVPRAVDMFQRSCRRRWWIIPLAAAVLVLGNLAHASKAPPVNQLPCGAIAAR